MEMDMEFYLESLCQGKLKIDIFEETSGKIEKSLTWLPNLIPMKTERNICCHCDLDRTKCFL